MKNTNGNLTLTNYVNRRTGAIYHGSELSYFDRFKSGVYYKTKSYQITQQPLFTKLEKKVIYIYRRYYNDIQLIDQVDQL